MTSETSSESVGPGKTPLSRNAIIGTISAATLLALFLLYTTFRFLPTDRCAPTPVEPDSTASADSVRADSVAADSLARQRAAAACGTATITYLGRTFDLPLEQRLFVLVVVAGALGAALHMLRSLTWYIGTRLLLWSWVAFYLTLPVVGGMLSAAFYLIVRGGFAPTPGGSSYGYAAVAVLIGMFTRPASDRLKEIAEAMFVKPERGPDSAGSETPPSERGAGARPKISGVTQQRRSDGASKDALIINGLGFTAGITALVNGLARALQFVSAERVLLELRPEDLARIEAGGDFKIVLKSAEGQVSDEFDFA